MTPSFEWPDVRLVQHSEVEEGFELGAPDLFGQLHSSVCWNEYRLFPLVGFKGNLSLDVCLFVSFPGALNANGSRVSIPL